MKTLLAFLSLAAVGCSACFQETPYPDTIDEGFVSLFDGTDLAAWEGSPLFKVEAIETRLANGTVKKENVIAFTQDISRPGENLVTRETFGDFVLRFEVRLPENGDSGIGVRMPTASVDAAYEAMCEIQLLDDGGSSFYDRAKNVDRLDRADRYSCSAFGLAAAKRDNVNRQIGGKDRNFTGGGSYMRRPGFWNFVEIRVAGEEVEVVLNGTLVTKADFSAFRGDGDTLDGKPHPGLRLTEGRIGLLGASKGVQFKNIRVLRLPKGARLGGVCPKAVMKTPCGFTPYFTGDESQLRTMWKGVTTEGGFDNPVVRHRASAEKRDAMQKKADALRDAHWHVRDGALFFDGFKGGYSLATARDYGDFELWADWRLLSITGDSGLYLRGAPQVQIWDANNEWGIGSGGLYNNQKNPSSATVIADKNVGDWNRFHVIMRGEKVSVWLNGVLVVDNVTLENYWDRKQAIFPVEQIELQCHGDPIEWRNVFIKEL